MFDPDDVFVLPGTASALRTIATAAGLKGRSVVVEEPGYDAARTVFRSLGVLVRGVPTELNGLDSSQLSADDAAAYITPAHQFPLGYRMSSSRRVRLLEWARATGGLLIEDDYDGEYRFNVAPSPALASAPLGRDVVAYIGTASTLLSPAMSIAWLVPPRHLTDRVRQALVDSRESVDAVTARALAHFIESGALVRHVARSARTYSVRRRAFALAFEQLLPRARVVGVDAGLHFCVVLPEGVDANVISWALRGRGILIDTVDGYPTMPSRNSTLMVSYASVPETKAFRLVQTIAGAVSELERRGGSGQRRGDRPPKVTRF
jgi:GntR family transcriptional regulator/MocR family aminotransferase